jgi:hypothetical protein
VSAKFQKGRPTLQSRADDVERDVALEQGFSQAAIGTTEARVRVREQQIESANGADVSLLGHDFFFRRAAISISLSRTR